jgi:hypothetical protein
MKIEPEEIRGKEVEAIRPGDVTDEFRPDSKDLPLHATISNLTEAQKKALTDLIPFFKFLGK